MDNNNNHINYTAADFERYHNGTMPETQMYALEKAALEDPFLADALDGYAFAKTPVADIEELAQQIPPKKEDKKVPVVGFTKMWLRIAAVLVLVTGIGYLAFRSTNENDNPISKTLAENKNNTIVAPANAQPAATKEDTTVQFLSTEKKVNEATAKGNGTFTTTTNQYTAPVAAPAQPSSAAYFKTENETRDVASNDYLLRAKEKTPSDLVKKIYQVPGRKYQLQGQVTDDNGEPVPFASINLKNKVATVADADGNFSLQAKDSFMLANISAAGYSSVNQNLSTNNKQNTITLGRQQTDLNEVVVTSMGTQRQKKDLGYSTAQVPDKALQGKVSGLSVGVNPQPVQGMAQYDLYIDSSRLQMATPALPLKGNVTLSFRVNRQGEPIHIKIEKSLSAEYDQAAIRILKQGPKWQFSHGKRATKIIEF